MFLMSSQEFEKPGLGIETVAQENIEASGLSGDDALHKPQGGGALVFLGAKQLEVQQEPEVRADQLEDDRAVIVLDALASIDRNLALLALRAAPLVAGVDFVAVNDGEAMAEKGCEHLFAPQLAIEVAQEGAQIVQIDGFGKVGDLVDTDGTPPEKAPEGSVELVPLPGVEAGEATHEDQEHGLEKTDGGNLRFFPSVAKPFQASDQPQRLLAIS